MIDVVVVGAGAAGLTAAIYLSRFHHNAVVIDGGMSRARWIPQSHNIPGFAQGIGGVQFLAQLREQALRFGAVISPGRVTAISPTAEGFQVISKQGSLHARFVVIATGVQDRLPRVPGIKQALLSSVLRICPICDAFEATNKQIAVIGSGPHAERETVFLRAYSPSVTLLRLDSKSQPSTPFRSNELVVLDASIKDLIFGTAGLHLRRPGHAERRFDVAYSALGCQARNQLAASLGAELDETGALRVNSHQETSIDRLYAAGDVVRGLNQIVVAAGEAAIAATDIHNRLDKSNRIRLLKNNDE